MYCNEYYKRYFHIPIKNPCRFRLETIVILSSTMICWDKLYSNFSHQQKSTQKHYPRAEESIFITLLLYILLFITCMIVKCLCEISLVSHVRKTYFFDYTKGCVAYKFNYNFLIINDFVQIWIFKFETIPGIQLAEIFFALEIFNKKERISLKKNSDIFRNLKGSTALQISQLCDNFQAFHWRSFRNN